MSTLTFCRYTYCGHWDTSSKRSFSISRGEEKIDTKKPALHRLLEKLKRPFLRRLVEKLKKPQPRIVPQVEEYDWEKEGLCPDCCGKLKPAFGQVTAMVQATEAVEYEMQEREDQEAGHNINEPVPDTDSMSDSQESWITQDEIIARRVWRCSRCIARKRYPTEEERVVAGQCCCNYGKPEFIALIEQEATDQDRGIRSKWLQNPNMHLPRISLGSHLRTMAEQLQSSEPARMRAAESFQQQPGAQILRSFTEWSDIKEHEAKTKHPPHQKLERNEENFTTRFPQSSQKQPMSPILRVNKEGHTSRLLGHGHLKDEAQRKEPPGRTMIDRTEPLYEELGIDRARWENFPRTPHGSYPYPSPPPPDDPLPIIPLRLRCKRASQK
ncbi:uncharacterized protein BP5553_02664 [Venustampulla echinocandica]|uniref:Uncharacterized protein n=1 Tax=Venustampulla echinocandica TaxID=2656787 RepID=A0A370TS33_9HELO|nr:uncharacterized protein BP5553_02664 [Venustampulla echinocandica]RDL38324.1 hypothetical protein BP5553_02664 [Venustampulla echinocandica]